MSFDLGLSGQRALVTGPLIVTVATGCFLLSLTHRQP
jgi:hypothetical protein